MKQVIITYKNGNREILREDEFPVIIRVGGDAIYIEIMEVEE